MTIAMIAMVAAACGGTPSGSESSGGLEKSKIAVGTMPIVDDVSFFLAQKNNLFSKEGLEKATSSTIQGGAAGIPRLGRDLDITFGNYVSMMQSQANSERKLRIVAEAYNAQKDVMTVMASPDSGINEPKDLKGKTVAVNTLKNVTTLTTRSVLATNDVNPDSVNFTTMKFPEMPQALKAGDVDAAVLVEPFIAAVKTDLGAHKVLDISTGPTEGFPIAGYVTTQEFYKNNPKTVKAFQEAIQQAQELAHDRSKVEAMLPKYTKIKPNIAAIVTLGSYPTTVEATRLQRVADLCKEFGLISKKLDVSKMVI